MDLRDRIDLMVFCFGLRRQRAREDVDWKRGCVVLLNHTYLVNTVFISSKLHGNMTMFGILLLLQNSPQCK